MQIAMRIHFARSKPTGGNVRAFVLALASGIAGLSIAYPTATAGTGPTARSAPAAPPDLSMTVKFHDPARAGSQQVRAPISGTLAMGRVPVGRTVPLDAVRVALPPATIAPGPSRNEPSAQAPHPNGQSLALNPPPTGLSVSAPGALPPPEPFSLASAPREVREFDLARLGTGNPQARSPAPASSNALAAAVRPDPRAQEMPRGAKVPDKIMGDHIIHVAALSLEGVPSGDLSVRVSLDGHLSVRLADLLGPVQARMAPDTFRRLAGSAAAAEYVSFADLRAAGFNVRYEAGDDRLIVSAQI
jgi:hypothetical protein